MQPLIFDIRRFALDDGPGIRTTVFFKGCPLACIWCHNPESIRPDAEISFRRESCLGCTSCASVCEAVTQGAAQPIERQRCTACGDCVEACPARALELKGRYYPPAELAGLLLRDRFLFEASGGGVTFSGGEPTLHRRYLAQVAAELRQHHVPMAIQTCGMFDFESFRDELLPFLDWVFFDLKLADPELHVFYTGQGNERILGNFRRLAAEARSRLVPRVPLVSGITATKDNLARLAELLKETGYDACDTLPYHPGGLAKRRQLGEESTPNLSDSPMSVDETQHWQAFIAQRLSAKQGSQAFHLHSINQ